MRSEREDGENETTQIPVTCALESRECAAVGFFKADIITNFLSTLAQPDS